MKNIGKVTKSLKTLDRNLYIFCVGAILMFLVSIILIILSVSAKIAITTIALSGMLMVIIIATNISSEIEKKHNKKRR